MSTRLVLHLALDLIVIFVSCPQWKRESLGTSLLDTALLFNRLEIKTEKTGLRLVSATLFATPLTVGHRSIPRLLTTGRTRF